MTMSVCEDRTFDFDHIVFILSFQKQFLCFIKGFFFLISGVFFHILQPPFGNICFNGYTSIYQQMQRNLILLSLG